MSNQSTQVLALPVEFVQTALSDLKINVDEIAASDKQVVLDAQAVERFDGAALQFLLAFSNSDVSAAPCVNSLSMPLITALEDIGVCSEIDKRNLGFTTESLGTTA
jgi:ABC-type transporter Mla MlaB component